MFRCDCGASVVTSSMVLDRLPCCEVEKERLYRDRRHQWSGRKEPLRLGHELFNATDKIGGILESVYGIICLHDGDGCGYRAKSKNGWGVVAYPGEDGRRYGDVMNWERFLDWLPHDAKALVLAHVALYDRYLHANRVL